MSRAERIAIGVVLALAFIGATIVSAVCIAAIVFGLVVR
jgi:hypothetical protein